jgi:hypothetical protein
MTASFPASVKTFATLVDFVDTYLAAHNNERGDEITAIETELGTDVAGTMTDLKTRLATVTIPLPAGSWLSTSDVASWASAQLQVKQSSAAVPSPRWLEWLFDDTTDEHVVIHFTVPANYSSAPVLRVKYKCTSAVAGDVAFEARVCAYSPDDAGDVDADAYDTVNAATETVPDTTAGRESIIDITLTNADSMAAGDEVNIALNRDVSADSVVGDIEVRGAQFRYTRA